MKKYLKNIEICNTYYNIEMKINKYTCMYIKPFICNNTKAYNVATTNIRLNLCRFTVMVFFLNYNFTPRTLLFLC